MSKTLFEPQAGEAFGHHYNIIIIILIQYQNRNQTTFDNLSGEKLSRALLEENPWNPNTLYCFPLTRVPPHRWDLKTMA